MEDLQKLNKDLNNLFSNHINASCKSNISDSCNFIFITSSQLKYYYNTLTCLSAPLFIFNVPYTSLPYSPPTILLLASAKSDYSPFPVHTSNYPALGFCSCCSPLLVKNKYFLSTFYIPSPVLDIPHREQERNGYCSHGVYILVGEKDKAQKDR